MEKKKLKQGEYDKMTITDAFDGLRISVVAIAEDLAAGNITEAKSPFPHKINLKLYNRLTDELCWDLSLAEAYLLFNRGQLENNAVFDRNNAALIIAKDTATSTNPTKTVTDYSFKFAPTHGVYELQIRVQDGAFHADTDASSYVTVRPNTTTEPMLFETRVTTFTMDKKNDTYKAEAGAVEAIVIMDEAELGTGDTTGFISEIDEIILASREESWNESDEECIGLGMSYVEDATTHAWPLLIVHDGHLLTAAKVTVEQSSVVDNKMYIVTQHITDVAEVSERLQDAKVRATVANM